MEVGSRRKEWRVKSLCRCARERERCSRSRNTSSARYSQQTKQNANVAEITSGVTTNRWQRRRESRTNTSLFVP